MTYSKKWLFTGVLFLSIMLAKAQRPITKESFNIINLNYPGLEKVKVAVNTGKYSDAAASLLQYYRQKNASKMPDFSNAENPPDINKPLPVATRAIADSALLHRFQPDKGYGYFDYGKDINWQYWPVKDNEVRWQLHRVRWWAAMALTYRATKDERYAREWMAQFNSWAVKNPLGLSADNDSFAWRPLEISDRVQSLPPTFSIFVKSPYFTPAFLMEFLKNYFQQADHLSKNFAAEGNHRLFEAQRTLFGGVSFPEYKNAPVWRKTGINVLNTEIKKQVYPDGVQWELSPIYDVAAIDIFLKAYASAKAAGLESEFPASYKQTVENMIMAYINFSLPNYQAPQFGDSWIVDKNDRLRQYNNWLKVFPHNQAIRYFATDGKAGAAPAWLSKALPNAGFYTFRNGWDAKATVMVLKASPPGEFHAHPDNGTFELWVNGRDFTPDAGVYVYSGDSEIMKLRNSYRQTRIHSTLTLNNENMAITNAHLDKWETGKDLQILTYTNPSYKGLNHQRSVLFIDQKYFLIIDKAIGSATGTVGTHFVLREDSKPVYDKVSNKVYTTYANGNNLLIQNLNRDKVTLKEEDGKVSYSYRKEMTRPLFVFEKNKNNDKIQSFISVLYPYVGNNVPQINLKENKGNDYISGNINISLIINGKTKTIQTKLY